MSEKVLPRIPLPIFAKMVESMSVDELRKIPASKLPREIPQDILRGITGERREILDDLLFEANSHHVSERLALEQIFGAELIPALDRVKTKAEDIVAYTFKNEVQRLEELVEEQLKAPSHSTEEIIQDHIKGMRAAIISAGAEKKKLSEHLKMLRSGFHLSGQYQPEFKDSIAIIKQQLDVINSWLGRINESRLKLVCKELDEKTTEVEVKLKRLKGIYWEIGEIKKRIESSTKAMGLQGAEVNQNHFIQELRTELQLMESEKPKYDIMVPEQDLTQWMDVVIDAHITPIEDNDSLVKAQERAQASLYKLLQRYCEAQVEAAQQVSMREFTTLDRDANRRYMLETERFVLKYFKNKDVDVKGWGVNEESLVRLEKFESEVLDLIRKHTPQDA